MSFNLKNLNMTCAPMYNAQSNNEIMGYMCDVNKKTREGFESSGSIPTSTTGAKLYDMSSTYKLGDQITFNGSLYKLTKPNTLYGLSPANKPQNWTNLTDPSKNYKEGQPYNNDVIYDLGNQVTFNGNLYRLTTYLDTEGNSPGDKPQIWANLTDPSKNYKNGQPYDNFLRYDVGNEVTFNGSLYKLNEFIGTGHSPANKPQIWNNLTDPSKNYKNGQLYNNSVIYSIGNEITFNGNLYRLISETDKDFSPANKPQIWINLTDPSKNYKNGQPYNNSIRYDVDNEVSFNGYLYRYIHHIRGATFSPDIGPEYWLKLIRISPSPDPRITPSPSPGPGPGPRITPSPGPGPGPRITPSPGPGPRIAPGPGPGPNTTSIYKYYNPDKWGDIDSDNILSQVNKEYRRSGLVFNQPLSYNQGWIVNKFITSPDTQYWIPLFDDYNFYNTAIGQPREDIRSIYFTISGPNSIIQPNIILKDSENTTQGISNYNNIMTWFWRYSSYLKPRFMITFTHHIDNKEQFINKSFLAYNDESRNPVPGNKFGSPYANYTSITPTFSRTYKEMSKQVENGFKRLTNPDNPDKNVMMLYLGKTGKAFFEKYVDKNFNYFDDSNIKDFGKLGAGIDLRKVRIEISVCAILNRGKGIYNWKGDPIYTD